MLQVALQEHPCLGYRVIYEVAVLSNVKGKSSVVMRALVSKPQLGITGFSEMLQGRLARNESGKPERQRCGSQ